MPGPKPGQIISYTRKPEPPKNPGSDQTIVHLRASASSWRSFSDCASRVQTQSMDAGEREGGRDANKFITLNLRFHK